MLLKRNYDRTKIIDPNYFVDKVSFNLNGEPIPLATAQEFKFFLEPNEE